MIGKTISHYRVLEKLGEGGMGEVYRAEDTNLGREVAIKVLPDLFAQDPQRLARFEREAKLLASLNHPNIAAIHSFEHADGLHFLVLELVEGETLAERVAKGPVPVEEALEICRQVAEGAEAAHEKGVIHRDLKPANVKITPEGQVKVLDFGLAKALEGETPAADISHSPTLTEEMTRSGVILGTAAYMSPEQARGKAVDKRADIWAFGCVLYECLVGRQVFGGETVTDIIGAIVHKEPDWNVLPEKTPWNIRALLRRCLEKDPDLRLRDIWDVRIEIKQALSGAVEKLPDLAVARQPVWTLRRTLLLVSGMVLVTAVAGVIGWILKPAPELPLHKFELAVDSLEAGIETPLAVSPDGKKVVYVSAGRLWIRELDQLEPRQLSRSEEAHLPFWSPDSAFVGYVAAGKLWRVPVSGGESTTISDLQGGLVGGAGATWGSNGQIVFSRGGTGLLEVSARGGDPQPLLELDPKSEGDFHQPHFLPDGRGVLFVVHRKQQAPDTLALLAGQTRKVLVQLEGQALWSPVYSPTGHILYRREPTNAGIWALPFSLSKLEVTGEPFLIVPEAMYPSVSSDRTLIYVRRASTALTQMVWVNRSGQVESAIGQPQRQWPFPALSPDGERVAVGADENDNWDIWIHDVARGTKTRLTFSDGMETEPAWSPAGDQIVFRSGDNPSEYNISVKAADGTGQPQTLVKGITPAFSPDGKFLLYSARSEETDWDLWYLPWDGDKKPVVFLQTDGWQYWPRVSPDGRYLAYVSHESGRAEVYLKLFPSAEGKWQVSVNGGHWPRWSSSGDRLFYAEGDYLMEVEVTTRPSLTLGTPRKLFTRQASGRTLPFGWPDGFDVAANSRFVPVQSAEPDKGSSRNPGITVVQNWFTEFKNDQ